MHICDITLSYTATSGGIRTYLDAKRAFLLENTDCRHTLIIPGEHDEIVQDERTTTVRIASPPLPGCEPYRFFWRPDKIRHAIEQASPDIIELGSFYVAPWPAFSFRKQQARAGRACRVVGFFHTDIAEAYVGQPLREACHDWVEAAEWLGEHFADLAEKAAESYVGGVFSKCDRRVASSPQQAQRLAEYGVDHVDVVPLGVDLQCFTPEKRSEQVRAALGVSDRHLVLLYAGRLDVEKHVRTLVDAVQLVDESLNPRLVLIGEGPMREELEEIASKTDRLTVLPYEQDKQRFAQLLAAVDIYVTAGPHETFGLSVIEAQASGLPVVGVRAGALIERVPDEMGRLGRVDDAAAFAQNIEEVARKRGQLGANARAHVEANFGWASTFETMLRIYRETLSQETPA